jgi:hypothetical protein
MQMASSSRFPDATLRRAFVGIASLATSVAVSLVPLAEARAETTPQLETIGLDPDATALTGAAGSQHRTAVEPSAVAFGSTSLFAFQLGRFADGNGGSAHIGWASRGDHLVDCFRPPANCALPGIPGVVGGVTYSRVTDPSAALDIKDGVALISMVPIRIGSNGVGVSDTILVSRSTDNLSTFDRPIAMFPAGAVRDSRGVDLDKNWTVCDNHPRAADANGVELPAPDNKPNPAYGTCYTTFTNLKSRTVYMTTSKTVDPTTRDVNAGKTWTAPVAITNSTGLGEEIVVGPPRKAGPANTCSTGVCPGRVTVVYRDDRNELRAFHSDDAGDHWTAAAKITDFTYHTVAGHLRSDVLPSVQIDPSGTIYAVWPDCRFRAGCSANDLVMTTSADGINWSPVARIDVDAVTTSVDRFIPGLGVDEAPGACNGTPCTRANAHLALTYYFYPDANCHAATCQLMVGFTSSTKGGQARTWSAPKVLAGPLKLSWLPTTRETDENGRPSTAEPMVGDYIATVFATGGGAATPVFATANARAANHGPRGRDGFDETIVVTKQGIALGP